MCILEMHLQCADRFFEVLPGDVQGAEMTVEDMVSHALLDLFDEGMVDEVTIRFPSDRRMGLQPGSIYIRAQCFCNSFILLPHTKENMKLALEKSICSLLKELFGPVNVDSVTFSPSPWGYEYDPARS